MRADFHDGLKSIASIATYFALYKTPPPCTIITGIATALISGLLPLPIIINLCNIGTLFAFIIVSVALLWLREAMPKFERKFKYPDAPATPILAILLCFYLMIHLQFITWITFVIWLLLGTIVYFAYSVRRHKYEEGKFNRS